MTPADIDALERLLGEATAGEWFVDHDRNLQPNVYAGDRDHWVALLPHQCLASLEVQANTNARAIAALHNAAPALLALARDGLAMRRARAMYPRLMREIDRGVDAADQRAAAPSTNKEPTP